ncbi:MAG: hypothetical protein ACQEQY_01365 [Halobacteriota archaeon]
MREVISRVPSSDSTMLEGAFIAVSLLLTAAAIGFGAGIFLDASTQVLGTLLAVSFASIAVMAVLYHRLFHDHRIVIEYDEDLW